jgi:hypothetical protein
MRVYCRVAPQLAIDSGEECIKVSTGMENKLPIKMDLTASEKSTLTYHLNGIFDGDTTQEDVFAEVRPFIQSAIDGNNVCIFAYGQSGAGKTYTMEGAGIKQLNENQELAPEAGILPRTAIFLFRELERLQTNFSSEFRIEISSLEIYCDKIRDLLSETNENVVLRADSNQKVVVVNQVWNKLKSVE